MCRPFLFAILAGAAMSAWGGEIIFVDPAREKAQALQPRQDVIEGEKVAPAGERAREAREYLNETLAAPPAVILRNAPPPSDAAKARQAARAWVPPAANSTNTSASRCRTENTVGGIEGATQGHTVIQGSTSDVNSVCK